MADAPRTPPRLSKKEILFRDAILARFNPSDAYRKAYDAKKMSAKGVAVNAQKMLKKPRIALAIALAVQVVRPDRQVQILPPMAPKARVSMEHRLEVMEAAIDVDPADYFDEFNHFLPIRDMPKHVRMAIAGFKVDPLSFVTEVKFVDRINATRLYSQLAGDIPVSGKGAGGPPRRQSHDLGKLTDEELREFLRMRRKAAVTEGEES